MSDYDLSVPNLNVAGNHEEEQAEIRPQLSSGLPMMDDGESSMEQFVDEDLDDDPLLSAEASSSLGDEGFSLPTPVASDLIDLSDSSFASKGSFKGLIQPEDPVFSPTRIPRVSEKALSESVRKVLDNSAREHNDADEMEPFRPPVLARPRTLTQGDRCFTPQSWHTAHISNGNFPISPASPMSRMSVRTARSETYYHTYETDLSAKSSPVPPFVVVHSTGHALVKVKHRSNNLPENFIDEDQGSTTSSNLSFRSWCRLSTIVVTAGLVVLASVTVAAGLIKARHDSSAPMEMVGEPSSAPQDVPTNGVFPVSEPSATLWTDDHVVPGNDGVVKLPYQETSSPSEEEEQTRPPRTVSPSLANDTSLEPTVAPKSETPSSAPSAEEDIPWNNYVIGLLAAESPDTFSNLDDNQSSQYKALKWLSLEMASEDTIVYNQDSSLQKFGLLCFWFATGGSNWNDNTGWLTPGANECSWTGVTCDNTNTVIALEFVENGLQGSIPQEIKLIKYLQALVLPLNSIEGSLPPALSEMSELVDLNLSGNQLTGPLPPVYGSLDMLHVLDVSGNALTGNIPPSIGSMGNLEVLNFCSNDFVGSVPSEIGALTYLRKLNLGRNGALSGTMPDSVCELGSAVARSALMEVIVDCSVECECCMQCCDRSNEEGSKGECCMI